MMPNSSPIVRKSRNSANREMGGALRLLGRQLIQSGRFQEARQSIELSLQVLPGQPGCHLDLGNLYYASGRIDEAANQYRQLLEIDPRCADGWYNLGVVLMQQGNAPEAERACRRALRFQPTHAGAHNNLAMLLQGGGRHSDAARHYRTAANLSSTFEEPRFNLACLLQDQGRGEEARRVYEELLAANPGHTEASNNLANLLVEMELPDEARERYLQTLERSPHHALAHWNLGLLQLRSGHWREGWRNYEWRLRQTPPPSWANRSPRPFWDGKPLQPNEVLLLTAEQGMGDAIQFARFIELARRNVERIFVECHPPLRGLFERIAGAAGVITVGDALPDHDVWLPMMSLPYVLDVTLETLPATTPYLSPDPLRVAYWRERLERSCDGLRGGVVWSGNSKYRLNQKRSILGRDFTKLERQLKAEPRVTWFSLQHGETDAGRLASFPDTPMTLDEIAAMIPSLDLVVSVDTSVAHLAGALASPVWTLLPYHADWRWMGRERDTSPWYPTMRLLRQSKPGDWQDVFERLGAALAAFAQR